MINHYHLNDSKNNSATTNNIKLNDPALYIPQPELIDAVNVSITLGLPLLLTGEPGTGKTDLANHLAWHFNLGEVIKLNIQTSSKSNDLFYRYNALAHFQYNQNHPIALNPDEIEEKFIRYQGLGAAIVAKSRKIVLLDEIDKASRDLPNDVLGALEFLSFEVPEIDKAYSTDRENAPIIIITSNSEKNLPDPFLRRVAYFHIQFPIEEKLLSILSSKVTGYSAEQLPHLIKHFSAIRQDNSLKLRKKPATAELIQWAYFLYQANFDPSTLNKKSLTSEELRILNCSYSILAKVKEDLVALKEWKLLK